MRGEPVAMMGHHRSASTVLAIAGILTLAVACQPADDGIAGNEPQARGYEVRWIGELRSVHRDGDARPRAALGEIEPGPGTFALGPLAGLRGEITVIDGRPFIARVEADGEQVDHGLDHEAAFLVFGRVASWQALPVPDDVRDLAALERWLAAAAPDRGLREGEPFPFKVETNASTVGYHVMSNPDAGDLVDRPHRELMRSFTVADRPVVLLGVYSTAHAGVFTHHGESTHIHVVSGDGLRSGHVDELDLGPGAVAHLPVP